MQTNVGDIFDWPIITKQDERAVLEVLRARKMSKLDVTLQFEDEIAAFHGTRFALGLNNGTASVHSAMFGCGVGVGDEVICQSPVIWASAIPAFSLGATVVFADIDPETLTLDPEDVERKITERTRAIVAVHYFGYPADMDAIVAIAARHDIKVIEDLSHAHGGRYRGKKVGTIGDVAAMSVMSKRDSPSARAACLSRTTVRSMIALSPLATTSARDGCRTGLRTRSRALIYRNWHGYLWADTSTGCTSCQRQSGESSSSISNSEWYRSSAR